MNLYQDVTAAGIPTSNHESDLYIPDTPESRAILAKYPTHAKNARSFPNMVRDGERWIDVPFAFEPFWDAKTRKP